MATQPDTAPRHSAGEIPPSAPPAAAVPRATIPGHRPRFVYLYHPDHWRCVGGEILPRLIRVSAIPGAGGNGPDDVLYPSGAIAAKMRQGWRQVPDDIEFECSGQKRSISSGQNHSTYIDWYDSTDGGIWAEAWRRPRMVAGRLNWRTDEEGRLNLLRAIAKLLPEPSDMDVEAALQEPLTAAGDLLSRADDPRAAAHLRTLLKQIPRKHIPPQYSKYAPEPARKSRPAKES